MRGRYQSWQRQLLLIRRRRRTQPVSDNADGRHHGDTSQTDDQPVFHARRRRWRWFGKLVRHQRKFVAQLHDRNVTSEWPVSLRSFPGRQPRFRGCALSGFALAIRACRNWLSRGMPNVLWRVIGWSVFRWPIVGLSSRPHHTSPSRHSAIRRMPTPCGFNSGPSARNGLWRTCCPRGCMSPRTHSGLFDRIVVFFRNR